MHSVGNLQASKKSLVWMRRDLRLHDHQPLSAAIELGLPILPVFIFDTEVLKRFTNTEDRRLSFIADALCQIDMDLRKVGGNLLVLYGDARELIPALQAEHIFAGADVEPDARARDETVRKHVPHLHLHYDHVLCAPDAVMKADGNPYRVFTPYAKSLRARIDPLSFSACKVNLKRATWAAIPDGIKRLKPEGGAKAMLAEIGYRYAPLPEWPTSDGKRRLQEFSNRTLACYKTSRDFMADVNGTSHLSPYLRFGLVSIREAARQAIDAGTKGDAWLNELIWRDFYAMILYHWPESATQEFNPKYCGMGWQNNEALWQAFVESRTGYPIVDAAMRELHATGWMHNRARMIVASFLTKHLLIDWRKGEEHFAQWLMDYDLASNVGGWQWAASTGTDAQPYFRIFNPSTQAQRFDPKNEYINHWLPEWNTSAYAEPVIEHRFARERAIRIFKEYALESGKVKSENE